MGHSFSNTARLIVLITTSFFGSLVFGLPQESISLKNLKQELNCERDGLCELLERTLRRDTLKNCRPSFDEIKRLPAYLNEGHNTIQGRLLYADIVYGPYGYHIYKRGNTLTVQSIIHFDPSHTTLRDIMDFTLRLRESGKRWSEAQPFDYNLKFQFSISEDSRYAFIRQLKSRIGTRGPYFSKWNPYWSKRTVTHESGHLLGLDDEYSYILTVLTNNNTTGCQNPDSVMCAGRRITNTHYYLFLRRALCQQKSDNKILIKDPGNFNFTLITQR